MSIVGYNNYFIIFNDYEGFLEPHNKNIRFKNKIGTEYANFINNLDNINKTINTDKLKSEIENKIVKLIINNTLNDLSAINELLSDILIPFIREIYNKYISYGLAKALKEDLINNLLIIIEPYLNFTSSVYDKDKLYQNITNAICNIINVGYNSMLYYEGKELIKPLKILNDTFDSYNQYFFRNLEFIEIPRHKVTYEIIKRNELISENNLSAINQSKNKKFVTYYDINSIKDFCSINIEYFINNKNIRIKKCKNCNKYFIPHNKQVYCDNISPQNSKYTCRLLPDDLRNNKNIIDKIYRDNYKTQSNKKNHNKDNIPNIQKKFDKWNELAKAKRDEAKSSGKLTLEKYTEWFLENNKAWTKWDV